MTILQTILAALNWNVRVTENFETLSAAGIFGKRHSVTTGLTWGYYGGRYNGNTIADGTVALGAGDVNYIVVNRATGVVSLSSSSPMEWDDTAYARLYKVTTNATAVTAVVDHRMDANGLLLGGTSAEPIVCIPIACSDETTALTTGTGKVTFRMPFAFTLTAIRASVTTAPTGATRLAVDVNESGTTILSTKLTFDASEKTTTTSSIPPVISDSSLADDAEITVDIDAVGSTIAGTGLKVYLIGRKA